MYRRSDGTQKKSKTEVYRRNDGRQKKSKTGVYCRNDGTQKLLYCTRSGISQVANAVHLTGMLCGFAYVSSEQVELHCLAAPTAVHRSVPQEDRPRLSILHTFIKHSRVCLGPHRKKNS